MTRASLTIFVDCIFLFIAVLLLLPHSPAEALDSEEPPPGSITVQVEWQAGLDVDLDLWVQAPNDSPVGYSNKGARIFNLLRDDLGAVSDVTPLNMEYSYSRGRPAGEYTVNLHLFGTRSHTEPLPAHVEIRLQKNGKTKTLFARDVVLLYQGQEITVQRFTLDEDGAVVAQSLIPRNIRSAPPRPGFVN